MCLWFWVQTSVQFSTCERISKCLCDDPFRLMHYFPSTGTLRCKLRIFSWCTRQHVAQFFFLQSYLDIFDGPSWWHKLFFIYFIVSSMIDIVHFHWELLICSICVCQCNFDQDLLWAIAIYNAMKQAELQFSRTPWTPNYKQLRITKVDRGLHSWYSKRLIYSGSTMQHTREPAAGNWGTRSRHQQVIAEVKPV